MFRKITTKSFVDSGGVTKHFGQIRVEQDHVSTLLVAFVVLAANTSTEVIFRSHFVVGWLILVLLHSFGVRQPSHLVR